MKLKTKTRFNHFTWYILGDYLIGNRKHLTEGYINTYTNKLITFAR